MTSPFDEVDLEMLRRRRTVKWSLYGPEVLAAWVAEMDFSVAPPVREALLAAVDREDFGYVEADTSELTGACAAFLDGRFGWEVPATRIFLVADVLVGIAAALDVSVAPGVPVVVPTPAYPPFFSVIELGGRPVVPVPMAADDGRFVLDLDAIDAAFAAGAGALLLCSPHNPTGRVFGTDELAALAAVVDRHGARVVADEVHGPLTHPGHRHVPYASVTPAATGHTLTVTSASKGWNLAGLKCAQVVAANHADAAAWRALPLFAVPGPTPLGITASTAAYRDAGAWLDDLVAYLAANTAHLARRLAAEAPAVGLAPPEATFLAWLDCGAVGHDDPAAHVLEHAGVAVSDGPPFGVGWEQHVRLNLGTSRALLDRILDAMLPVLADDGR